MLFGLTACAVRLATVRKEFLFNDLAGGGIAVVAEGGGFNSGAEDLSTLRTLPADWTMTDEQIWEK